MKTAADWDERFRQAGHGEAQPDAFLVRCADAWDQAAIRQAADIACGAGRNAVFLAKAGFHVTAVDHSAEALRLTRERCLPHAIETRQIDLESPDADLGEKAFDLVCVFRFLHRPLFPALRRSVRPGGLLIYQTYTTDQLTFEGGPRNPRFLLEPGELPREFASWRVLRYEEEWRGRGTAALLARKP
jgi:SAM-dependent methyltransferase